MIGVKCFSFILFALPTLFPPGCVALIYRLSVYREDLQADFICGMIAIVTAEAVCEFISAPCKAMFN
jgi:hypothetical protein